MYEKIINDLEFILDWYNVCKYVDVNFGLI